MKKAYYIAAALLLILAAGCSQEPKPKTVTKLEDPTITIKGVPQTVNSGESFTVRVETDSPTALTLKVNQPSYALLETVSETSWKITAFALDDVNVKITVSQPETKRFGFYAATKDAKFKIIGSGHLPVPAEDDEVEGTAVTYEEEEGEVVSPERGIYHGYEVYGDTPACTAADVVANVKTGHTLWLLEFYLTDYMTGTIEQEYLDKMQACFDAIRDGGAKAIVRFAYRNDNSDLSIAQEPEASILLGHIAQVKPILQANEDVLFVLQAGFIGTWGEWYYTTHFKKFSDRKPIVKALLDAVPPSRQIQLRTPKYKIDLFDLTLADTLTAETAHDGDTLSRIGGHNDCFGADASDEGTFEGAVTRDFWKADTRYAIMGGETCKLSDFCLCPQTLQDLEDYHWTYLHDGYNVEVLNRWKTDGCFDEIKSKLGYRIVLKDVHYEAIEAGKPCKVTIRFHNKGYAAPMNPRQAWLVWETPEGKKEKFMLGTNPTKWQPGYNGAVGNFIPSTATGTLYLELPDPLLPDDPAYSMVLANKDIFDPETGFNKLFEVE